MYWRKTDRSGIGYVKEAHLKVVLHEMVDFIVMVASVVLVDPRIKPDTVVTVLDHVVRQAL